MSAAILFLACNRLKFNKASLEALLPEVEPPNKLVIADNGSVDGTKEYFESLEEKYPNHDYVYFYKNYGRDRPRSWFQHHYKDNYKYLGFVSNDVYVSPNWVEDFKELLRQPDVGIVGPVDRDWGKRDLVTRGAVKFYGGYHFYFSDAYWLMKSSVIDEIRKQTLKVDEHTVVDHPGYFVFNSFSRTQEWYWDSIKKAGFHTACHPAHGMRFVYSDSMVSDPWHKKYAILSKYVYCKDPGKYAKDTGGLMQYLWHGESGSWEDEPVEVQSPPEHMLKKMSEGKLASLDYGVGPDDLSIMPEDQWGALRMEDIFGDH